MGLAAPDAKWPDVDPEKKVEVLDPLELRLYHIGPDGTGTQTFGVNLAVPEGHYLVVKIGDQTVYSSPEAKKIGLEETVEVKVKEGVK